MDRFPAEFEDLLNRRGRKLLFEAPQLEALVKKKRTPILFFDGVIDSGVAAECVRLLDEAMYPVLKRMYVPIPREALTGMRENYGEKLRKTVRVRTATMNSRDSIALRAAREVGLAEMMSSPSFRRFAQAVTRYNLREDYWARQVICYETGDYSGPHNDHHPQRPEARNGFMDFHIMFSNASVAQQLLVYEEGRYLSVAREVTAKPSVAIYRLPFWHYTTPLVARRGHEATARRWLLLGSFDYDPPLHRDDSSAPMYHAGRMAAPDKRIPLHTKILIGLVAGAAVGGTLNSIMGAADPNLIFAADQITNPIGQLFLRLLLLIVVPLVFSSLVIGVAGLGDLRRVGRIGVKSLVYTLVISAISVIIGLTLANTIKPGKRISPEVGAQLAERYKSDADQRVESAIGGKKESDPAMLKLVKTIVPTNVFYSVGRETPDMLGLMFFAVFIGACLTMVEKEAAAPLLRVLEAVFAATEVAIKIIMRLAPYAVFCLLFTMTARFGFGLMLSLGWFVLTVLLGLSLHMFGVYSLSLWLLSRINPLEFFRRTKTAMITAFSTSSSNATLPTALRVSEENLGVPRDINSFVLTVGATANQNGTALYEGVTVLFLAQLAGVDLSLAQQLMVVYLAILGGVGTAGVPSGSIPFIIVVLAQINVNPALIAIILGVDRILDMCRTVLNVTGDITIATYVARSEGAELLKEIPEPPAVDL